MSSEESIFDQALRQPAPQREMFLDRACAGNKKLRCEVEGLLLAHERAAGFLQSPPAALGLSQESADAITQGALGIEQPGAVVGNYKLLEQLGEGGMGVVYMAEQLRPVRRKVALKIIKPGLDTTQVIARFEAERQALAVMDHPSIAKVFDAGATDTGRPYFVMELVRGIPITEYCDQQRLTSRERLELFVQVCQAVQHAHQKGVIHRDLKPSNVLVTLQDGAPTPKVIDFGVAKATAGQRLTEQTLFTEFRQLIGTPLYMSPEQAEMSALLDLDTRSDVYSLGVLLYELLTGSTPFDKQRLAKAAYDEVRRIIREEDPPRPSTRISTLGQTLTTICAQRQTDPNKLGSIVRGELDWIVMRALEKDRTRRYETASGLARDVERYLADQPVEACPPSRIYRLKKFARRNKAIMMTGGLIAAVLVLATAVSTWHAVRATRARNAETRQRTLAQQATAGEAAQRKQADAVAGLLGSIFKRLDPFAEQKGDPDLKAQLVEDLDRTAATLEKDYAGQGLVRARLRNALGTTQLGLGEIAKAVALLQSAVDEQRTHADPDDPRTLEMISDLANAFRYAGRTAEAINLFEEVREQRVKRLGPNHPDTLATMNNLGVAYLSADRTAEAIALLEQVRDWDTTKLGPDDPETLSALHNLGRAYGEALRTADALTLLEQVRDRKIQKLGPDHPDTLRTLHDLALEYAVAGRSAEAVALFEKVLAQEIKKLGPDHPFTLPTLGNLTMAYLAAGRTGEAITLLEKTHDRQIKTLGPDHRNTLVTLSLLARAYRSAGRTYDVMKVLEQVRDHWLKELSHPDADLDVALPEVISCYREMGHGAGVAQWEAKLRAVLEADAAAMSREITPDHKSDPKLLDILSNRASLYLRLSRFKEADDDLARYILLEKGDHYSYYYRGCLLAYLGDLPAYQVHCKAMFEQFGNSSDGAAIERTAKTCLLLPDGRGGDPKQMLALIERALALPHDAEETWYALTKASALYRGGDFPGCVEWAQKASTPDSIVWPARKPTAELLAAMAHFKLGHADQAKTILERTEQWAEKSLPEAGEGDLGWGEVVNWLCFQTLRREAEELINGKGPTTQAVATTHASAP